MSDCSTIAGGVHDNTRHIAEAGMVRERHPGSGICARLGSSERAISQTQTRAQYTYPSVDASLAGQVLMYIDTGWIPLENDSIL